MNEENEMRMRAALIWHLQNNFIPAQPPELVEYCLQAIDACSTDDPTRAIELPGGVTVTAEQLVYDLRLELLVDPEDFEYLTIISNARKALTMLTEADNMATELSNRGELDYHKSSAMATHFLRVLQPLRELIEYLEREATWNKQ